LNILSVFFKFIKSNSVYVSVSNCDCYIIPYFCVTMNIKNTTLRDCYIIEPTIIEDERGYFYEKYNRKNFEKLINISFNIVQENISKSSYGVLRGLHLQRGKFAQAKLISCIKGKIWDIAVDMRENSSTFGKYFGLELSEDNNLQFFLPRGFAHGFVTLSENAIISYKCDNFYNKYSEFSIRFNDPDLAIDWKISETDIILSEKDKNALFIKNLEFNKLIL